MTFQTYHFFASQLVNMCPSLSPIKAFGTDGEKVLYQGFATVFPKATHLRCFNHFKSNVEAKLKELNFDSHSQKEIMSDIMDVTSSGVKELGLIDADDNDNFNAKLESLQVRWNQLELSGRLSKAAEVISIEFFDWFKANKAKEMAESMIKSARTNAGLGECPPPFYTNLSESLNRHLKRKVDRKSSRLSVFVEQMRELAAHQKSQVENAIIRKGSWRLADPFKHLEVLEDVWFTVLDKNDREKKLKKLLSYNLKEIMQPLISAPLQTHLLMQADVNLLGSSSSLETPVIQKPLSLNFAVLNGNNIQIHEDTLKAMWSKAEYLVNNPKMISNVPGHESPYSRMVTASSKEIPHFVSVPKEFTGQFICDSHCPMFASYKICSHTLAAAEVNGQLADFLLWFNKTLRRANLTKLSDIGMPTTSGKKKKSTTYKRKKKDVCKTLIATTNRITEPAISTSTGGTSTGSAFSDQATNSVLQAATRTLPTSLVQGPIAQLVAIPQDRPSSVTSVVASPTVSPSVTIGTMAMPVTLNVNSFCSRTGCQTESPYPFTLKFINNRIQKCQGCKLDFCQSSSILQPPHDLIVARLERRPFVNTTGDLSTPWKPSHAHYHLDMGCIRAADNTFVPSSLAIPPSVEMQLLPSHKDKLQAKFGLKV